MGPNYLDNTGRRPRDDYGPRKLIPIKTRRRNERLFGKSGQRQKARAFRDESLPAGWSVLEPNRIKERRLAKGIDSTAKFAEIIGSISYQRLNRLENGVVAVRDSEYELLALYLNLKTDDLKLPMLTHSETVQWMGLWGTDSHIEEGGDHDAVILSAYVRKSAAERKLRRNAISSQTKTPANAMHYIWYAAKPIDRYPDTTMKAVMWLTGKDDWQEVVDTSQALYRDGVLDDWIKEVQKPRVRYAPEDPDRRAPWTYEVDPFREREPRSRIHNAYTCNRYGMTDTRKRQMKERNDRIRRRISQYRSLREIAIKARSERDPAALLKAMLPNDHDIINEVGHNHALVRMMILRVAIIRYARAMPKYNKAPYSIMLNVTPERLRQMLSIKDEGTLMSYGLNNLSRAHNLDNHDDIEVPEWNEIMPRIKR